MTSHRTSVDGDQVFVEWLRKEDGKLVVIAEKQFSRDELLKAGCKKFNVSLDGKEVTRYLYVAFTLNGVLKPIVKDHEIDVNHVSTYKEREEEFSKIKDGLIKDGYEGYYVGILTHFKIMGKTRVSVVEGVNRWALSDKDLDNYFIGYVGEEWDSEVLMSDNNTMNTKNSGPSPPNIYGIREAKDDAAKRGNYLLERGYADQEPLLIKGYFRGKRVRIQLPFSSVRKPSQTSKLLWIDCIIDTGSPNTFINGQILKDLYKEEGLNINNVTTLNKDTYRLYHTGQKVEVIDSLRLNSEHVGYSKNIVGRNILDMYQVTIDSEAKVVYLRMIKGQKDLSMLDD